MTLRPTPARWFELLTDRAHLGAVLTRLAATGRVELQARSGPTAAQELPDFHAVLAGYGDLARRFAPYWPAPRFDPELPPPESVAAAAESLAVLDEWARAAEPTVERLQALAIERSALVELAEVFGTPGLSLPPLAALAGAGPTLAARLYVRGGTGALEVPAGVLVSPVQVGERRYVVALGEQADVRRLDATVAAEHGRSVPFPPRERIADVDGLRAAIDVNAGEQARLRRELERLSRTHRLPGLLARFSFLEWLVAHVPRLPATENFAWVTGWTSDLDGAELRAALDAAAVPYLLHFPEEARPEGAPMILRNPGWARPFELFVGLLGTPGAREADPSMVVAVVAPLLFGYMFGDVGQGAVLLATGLLLRRRLPALALLVPGGLASIAFGFVWGSVFAREDLIPPLWVHPLEAPLAVVGASVAIGVALLACGLVLDALEHAWIGEGRRWLALRGGVLPLYAGLVTVAFWPPGWLLLVAGAAWILAGPLLRREAGETVAGRAGELLETGLQLVVNTVSFARVGAFALAHAGLSVAVVGLAEAAGSSIGYVVVLALGNVLILVLEGLVVGIQTTRLVLFEFFIRFLRAEGRPFRPLPAPGGFGAHSKGESS